MIWISFYVSFHSLFSTEVTASTFLIFSDCQSYSSTRRTKAKVWNNIRSVGWNFWVLELLFHHSVTEARFSSNIYTFLRCVTGEWEKKMNQQKCFAIFGLKMNAMMKLRRKVNDNAGDMAEWTGECFRFLYPTYPSFKIEKEKYLRKIPSRWCHIETGLLSRADHFD